MLNKIFWFNNSANCNIYNVLSQVVSVEQHTKFFKYIPYFNLHTQKNVYSIDIIPYLTNKKMEMLKLVSNSSIFLNILKFKTIF